MALNNFRQQTNEPEETNHNLCSVPGCGKRWAVQMEGSRPMCSQHQWGGKILKPIFLFNLALVMLFPRLDRLSASKNTNFAASIGIM
jgi:hypothetical protein